MSTIADLPASWRKNLLTNFSGNGAFSLEYTATEGGGPLSWHGPFADFQAFRTAALFQAATITLTGGGSLTKIVPLVHPFDDAFHAVRLSIRPFRGYDQGEQTTADDPWAVDADPPWPELLATVTFGVLPYATGGDAAAPFLSIKQGSNPQRITIPNAPYELVDESDVFIESVAQDISVPIAEERLTFTWHGVTDLPAINTLTQPIIHTLNDATITLPDVGLVCDPGTLHVAGRDSAKTLTLGSIAKSEFSLTATWRPIDWNRYLASKPPHRGIFRRANPLPIPYADHTVLTRGY